LKEAIIGVGETRVFILKKSEDVRVGGFNSVINFLFGKSAVRRFIREVILMDTVDVLGTFHDCRA
jgi:hypothetical protein